MLKLKVKVGEQRMFEAITDRAGYCQVLTNHNFSANWNMQDLMRLVCTLPSCF